MKTSWKILWLPALLLLACDRDEPLERPQEAGELYHGMIELGEKLDDPYTVANIQAALEQVDPTKAGRVEIKATDLYVRFLTETEEEYDRLKATGICLLDHRMDYQILRAGDYYHDPALEPETITWQYAAVPHDCVFQ